jgi:hypothetical protein
MGNRVVSKLSAALIVLVAAQTVTKANAGCLAHPEQYRLQSDTVHWSIVIAAGSGCIQGLRGRTVLLEKISIVDQPKTGNLVLDGPSFRYSATPAAGVDSFKLLITGTSVRIYGSSLIEVDVAVR